MTELIFRSETRQAQYFQEPLELPSGAVPLDMILIPAGEFSMGSPEDEPERRDSESPQHRVSVRSFFLGRYPITQAQYEAVMGTNPATRYAEKFIAPNKPVIGVSWEDAVEFCDRLAKQTGRPYGLPSEAEWEYAARAGTKTPFYFGKTLTTDIANYNGNYTYNDGPQGQYRQETTPVDFFNIANGFGLADMHGNVYEWCQDHWHNNYQGAPTDGTAWLDDEGRRYKVIRGGSWSAFPGYCRCADRYNDTRDYRNLIIGFRVACGGPRT